MEKKKRKEKMSELFQSVTVLPLVGNPAIGQSPNFKAKPRDTGSGRAT